MISRTSLRILLTLPLIALFQTGVARADDDAPPPQPPDPYPAPPPQPIYTAPLSQQTQTTYVPQSVALSGPRVIKDVDGRAVPDGYTPVLRKNKGLLVGGAVTFGVVYGYSVLIAAIESDVNRNPDGTSGENQLTALWIPVAGPFIQLAQTESSTGRFFLGLSGAAQLAGAVMLYYGMTAPRRVFIRNDLVGNLTVMPMAGNGANGAMLSGQF